MSLSFSSVGHEADDEPYCVPSESYLAWVSVPVSDGCLHLPPTQDQPEAQSLESVHPVIDSLPSVPNTVNPLLTLPLVRKSIAAPILS